MTHILDNYPDYESKKKELWRLIEKRNWCGSNLTKEERELYEVLCEWWYDITD